MTPRLPTAPPPVFDSGPEVGAEAGSSVKDALALSSSSPDPETPQDHAEALEAFARFTELSGRESNIPALAQKALEVLRSTIGEGSTAWYVLEDGLWKAKAWFGDLDQDTIEVIRAGVSPDAPTFDGPARTLRSVFTDAWDANVDGLGRVAEDYGAVCMVPIIAEHKLHSMFAAGLKTRRRWSERDKAVIRAVGRSLTLAVERAEVARQLAEQALELEARNRALEAFATLSRDLSLETDPPLLIARAQELALELLPPGVAVYYELRENLWRATRQIGRLEDPGLQEAVDAGLPFERTRSLHIPYTTREPYYQDTYDQDTDNLRGRVAHINATAALPILVGGAVHGIFVVALFHERGWTRADRAVLETVTHSLALALERGHAIGELREKNRTLEERNADQETFVYTVSHDLRAPLLSISGMSEVLAEAIREHDQDGARFALTRVQKNVEKMSQLLSDLLQLSRSGRQAADESTTINLAETVTRAAGELEGRLKAGRVTLSLPDEWPDVRYAGTDLYQLVANLLGNAVKFGGRDGQDPKVRLDWTRAANSIHLLVEDNGPGVPEAQRERVFGLFQRLNPQAEGTGVGLAIVKRIAERHGGRVWIEDSQDLGGALVGVTLPAA